MRFLERGPLHSGLCNLYNHPLQVKTNQFVTLMTKLYSCLWGIIFIFVQVCCIGLFILFLSDILGFSTYFRPAHGIFSVIQVGYLTQLINATYQRRRYHSSESTSHLYSPTYTHSKRCSSSLQCTYSMYSS